MSTTTTHPEPDPDDLSSVVEDLLADLANEPDPSTTGNSVGRDSSRLSDGDDADQETWQDTKRVRDLRAEVAEAHRLLALQADEAALLVDTPKVRKRRKQGAEAARLHALANEPALLAWQAARWRRVLTAVAFVSLVLALGWSTAGVQVFASEGGPPWSSAWMFAWLVEPFMSLSLLTVVAAEVFLATRGQPLEDKKLRKIKWLFLGLTLGMNAWPHLPKVTSHFTVSGLVLHILGPIVAVAIATALPIIWGAFADLDHGDGVGATYSPLLPQSTAETGAPNPSALLGPVGPTDQLVARARSLIKDGRLPRRPSATELRKALGIGTPKAQKVRDALKGES